VKKILLIPVFILVVVVLIYFGVIYQQRQQSAQYQGTAVPYLKMVIPEFSRWDVEIIKRHMVTQTLDKIPEEQMTGIVASLSRLGALQSMAEPEFSSVDTFRLVAGGELTMVTYKTEAVYEQGPAVVTMSLVEDGDSFRIHNFHINSPLLAE
jgi:hypothetical protein